MILLSANSLNTLSIERYLKQQFTDAETEEIKLVRIKSNIAKEIKEDLSFPLIFISHMKEGEEFTNVNALSKQLNKSSQEVEKYINLQNLPYNPLWKNRIINSAHQPYAVQTYLLENQ